jgi:hypothetical protein
MLDLRLRAFKGGLDLYSGSLIQDLLASVEKAERLEPTASSEGLPPLIGSSSRNEVERSGCCKGLFPTTPGNSEPKEFPQAFGLRPADWNLALLLIIHAHLVRALEPGHDFPNSIYIDQIGPVSAPEQSLVQAAE